MWGEKGNDTYEVDNGKDEVYESRGQGIDLVKASVSYTLGKNVENLTLTGTQNLNGTGNDLANILVGNSGNNVLKGGKGNDDMTGGAGNDIFVFGRSGRDTVTDFRDGEDKIDVSRLSGVDDSSDLNMWQIGSDTIIWYKTDAMVLKGVNMFDLSNSDFIL